MLDMPASGGAPGCLKASTAGSIVFIEMTSKLGGVSGGTWVCACASDCALLSTIANISAWPTTAAISSEKRIVRVRRGIQTRP